MGSNLVHKLQHRKGMQDNYKEIGSEMDTYIYKNKDTEDVVNFHKLLCRTKQKKVQLFSQNKTKLGVPHKELLRKLYMI